MTKLVPAILFATIAFAGTAIAQTDMPPPPGGPGGPGGGMGALMRADTNGDGIITRDEASAAADRTFDRIDTNHDGKITPDEMAAYHEAMMARRGGGDAPVPPPGGGKPMPGMSHHADPDGDGVITRDDYRARALARFDRIDANHDGRIDRTEMANMREMRMERRDGHGASDDGTPPSPPAPPPGQ